MTQVEGRDAYPAPPHPHNPAATAAWPPADAAGQPAPPAAPATPPQLPFGLTQDDLGSTGRVLLQSFAPVLAGLTVLVALFGILALDDDNSGSLADWIRTAVLLIALAMAGRATVDGEISGAGAVAEAEIALRVMPLTVTLVVLALVARSSYRAERQQPAEGSRHLAARAGLTGLAAGLVLALVSALSRTSSLFGFELADEMDMLAGGVDVGAGILGAGLGALVLVGLTALGARAAAAPQQALAATSRVGWLAAPQSRAVLRTLRTFVVGLVVVTAVALVLYFLYQALLTDDMDDAVVPTLIALLLLAVNAVVVLALGGLGVPVSTAADTSGSSEVLEFLGDDVFAAVDYSFGMSDKPVLFLVLLVPAGIALLTAVRRTLRDGGGPATPGQLKLAAAVGAVAGLAAALLVQVSLSGSLSGDLGEMGDISGAADASAGPALLWAPLLGAAWAAAAVWALRFGPTLALSLPPRLVRLAAGRAVTPEWSAALAGAAPAPAGQRSPGVRLAGLLLVAAAALAVLAAAAVALVNALVFTPAAAAEDYFDAAADADVAAVVGQLSGTQEIEGQPLLSAAVLESEDFTPLSGLQIGEVVEEEGYATVQVSYSVDGERHQDSISLTPGEDRFGFLNTWEINDGLPSVEIWSESGLSHEIAGTTLEGGSFMALPGGYTVHAGEHVLLTAEAADFVVTTDAPAGPTLDAEVKPEAEAAADDAVREALAECAASTQFVIDGCPFGADYWWGNDITDVTYAITQQPTWSLQYDEYVGGFSFSSLTAGEYVVRGTEQVTSFFSEPEERPYLESDLFYVEGEVTVQGDQFEVSFY